MICMWSGCTEKPCEYWYITTDNGLVERVFCWHHATEARGNDRASFGEAFVAGSDEGEA
jgi:hypothetical protein